MKPVVLVTGGSGGIGKAIVNKFIENKYYAIILDINNNNIFSENEDVLFFQCDITSIDQIKEVVLEISKIGLTISSLVNVAGRNLSKSIKNIEFEEWDSIIKTNVYGTFNIVKLFLPFLREGSVIVNIASDQSEVAKPNRVAYCASKGAILQFTRSLAIDLASMGIRAVCVSPGTVNTEMLDKIDKHEISKMVNAIPLRRLGTPDEVASLVYFLSQECSGFITGSNIMIDGGFTAK